ncbi:MAG: nitroreductase family protein [Dehalococcoidales bacterium]
MEIFEVIKNRRSIRHYKADPVDDKAVQQVLDAAHWAPSWGNMQCWRFIVICDAKIKSDVADTLDKVKVDTEWVENAAAASIRQAPVLIVICAEKGKAGYSIDGTPLTNKSECWYLFDVALAVENLTLAAHALGLGTVIIGGFNMDKVAKLLNVSDNFTIVTMTPLGFPQQKGQVSPRKGLDEVLFKDKFGSK